MSWGRVSLMVCLLLGFKVAFNAISHGENVPIHHALASFPMQIGAWKGKDLRLDPRVVDLLKADDLLLRVYSAPNQPPISLFLAYFQSQRQGQTIHSPKNCLPGAGWEPVTSAQEVIPLEGQEGVLLNRYVVENGLERQLVFYWYQSHGRTVASEFSAKAYMVVDAIRLNRTDGALVRVLLPLVGDEAGAEKVGHQFVREIYPLLRNYIPE